jgi:hypothetical protein
LNKQTVTNIVSELIEYKLVMEETTGSLDGAGRKPVLLRLCREHIYAIGSEVTKGYIS